MLWITGLAGWNIFQWFHRNLYKQELYIPLIGETLIRNRIFLDFYLPSVSEAGPAEDIYAV